MKKRVITYIDGFNLYYGLKEKGWKRYYWLDIQKLSESLIKPWQELIKVKYFTARISAGEKDTPDRIKHEMQEKQKRQTLFLEAILTLDKVSIFEGSYLPKTITCRKCGNTWFSPEEKMTDVNIATELLVDTYNNKFDTALLISGDSDLVPPMRVLKANFPEKRVIIAFPPARFSNELKSVSDGYFIIGESNLRKSVFPDQVIKNNGYILEKPKEWS